MIWFRWDKTNWGVHRMDHHQNMIKVLMKLTKLQEISGIWSKVWWLTWIITMAQQMMRIDRDVGCGVILRGAVSLAVSTSQVCLSHHSFLCQCLGFLVLQNFTILTVQAHLSFYFSCCDFMDVRITNNSFYLKASRHPSWWYVPRRENRINVSIGVKKKYNVWTTEIWLLEHGNPNSW